MSTANETQVGGSHYRVRKIQHWDLAIALELPYLEGQITKYVDRHPRKNGRQDLEKAGHFTAKLIESFEAGRVGRRPALTSYQRALLGEFFAERHDMSPLDVSIIGRCCIWQTPGDLLSVRSFIASSLASHYPDPTAPRPGS